jgi:hypothetical protein
MAAGSTYTPIATTTLGTATSGVSFSSFSSAYTDLIIIANFQYDTSGIYTKLTFNGDNSGTTYSFTYILGDGSTASSGRNANTPEIGVGYIASTGQSTVETIYIFNYSNTTTYKTVLDKNANAGNRIQADVGLWRNTAAITSIALNASAGAKYIAGSTFTLYGIQAA